MPAAALARRASPTVLEKYEEAFKLMESGECGKVVLIP